MRTLGATLSLIAGLAGCSQTLDVFQLEPPTRLSARSLPNGGVYFEWAPVSGADGYRIYSAPASAVTSKNWDQLGGTVVDAPDPGQVVYLQEQGVVHSFVLTATAGERESADSPRVSARPQSLAPLPATPDQILRTEDADSRLGTALAAGDVNCDGRDDLLIGGPELPATISGGNVFLHLARASGFELFPDTSFGSTNGFGSSIAVGDVTGDGCADMLVGGPLHSQTLASDGEAFLYRGGPTEGALELGSLAWIARGDAADERLGERVAILGDVDGDGFGDFAVTVPGHSGGEEIEVYAGSGSIPATSVLSYLALGGSAPDPIVLAPVGDVTEDGRADLFTGGPGYDFSGPSNHGRAAIQSFPDDAFSSVWDDDGTEAEQRFGSSAAAVDVDGNGFPELVVGSPGAGSDLGALDLYLRTGDDPIETTSGFRFTSTDSGGQLGYALASPGDIDGDGLGDLFASAPLAEPTTGDERGRVRLFIGGYDSLDPAWSVDGPEAGARFGHAIATGDFDGNGVFDLAVGAPRRTSVTFGADLGEVAIFFTRVGLGPLADAGETIRGTAGEALTPHGAWFQDRARRRHWRCTWDPGDTSAPGIIDPCEPATAGSYTHTWTKTGIYPLVLRIERVDDGLFGEAATVVVIE